MKIFKFGNKNILANQVHLAGKPVETANQPEDSLQDIDRFLVGVVSVSPTPTVGGWYNNTEVMKTKSN